MLGKAGKLGIPARSSEDLGVACSDRTSALALERTGHDRGPAGLGTGVDELVDELDQLVWQTDGDLLAHPKMVPAW